VCNAGVLQLNG